MLIWKLEEAETFTKNEKVIAEYILHNLDKIGKMTAEQLAKETFTSKSAIIRLCQKLDLKGYQEFKLKLVAEINQQNRITASLAKEPITQTSTTEEIIKIVPHLYDKVITDTQLTLNMSMLNRILNYLKNATEIQIYATGVAYHLGQAAAFKFATLGYTCQAFESVNTYSLARNKNKKIVSLVISLTGANKTVIQTATYLKNATNHYIVGILGPHLHKFQEICDTIIEIPNRDSVLNLDIIRSASAVNYIFDVLFVCLLTLNYESNVATAYRQLPYNEMLLSENYGLDE